MTYASASGVLHGACAAVFLVLATLVLVRGKVSRTGLYLAAASLATAAWSGTISVGGGYDRTVAAIETIRVAAWALFTAHLLGGVLAERRRVPIWTLFGPIFAFTVACLAIELPIVPELSQAWLGMGDWVLKMLLGIWGFLLLENLYRNAIPESRWHINLLCIGIGALFVFDIALYADAALFHRLSPDLFVARAPVDAITAPLIALAAARNRRWLVDIHVSRSVVFYSSTLVISGLFLLSIGIAGEILRDIGVTWGPVLEITLIFGGILLVAVLFTSGGARSRLRAFIFHNFFTYRYDYRHVWLTFIDTLSNPSFSGEQLGVRVIRAVADTVDSPAGMLWLHDRDNTAFAPVASWNVPIGAAPVGPEFAESFRGGAWIVEFAKAGEKQPIPETLTALPRAWLAVPLSHLGRLLGFILLNEPRAPIRLNWENYDLLRIVGRQVASYLAEEQAARALVEARQLHDYGQRFAFVVHDIKNLVSQLSLVLSNGERHADDPEFQKDVLETVRHSVGSMNKLLAQLRANREAGAVETLVPAVAVEEIIRAWRPRKPVDARFTTDGATERVRMSHDQLDSALRQLLDNAAEVSPEGSAIWVEVRHEADKILVDVRDCGDGMPADFIANQLFKPFRSTKSEGYGIGAYQTREIIRAARGDLLVLSEPGKGTTMRIVLPIDPGAALSSPPAKMLRVIS